MRAVWSEGAAGGMSSSARSQDAGNKIKDVLDDAFATILQDGVGQFDRLFLELNSKFDAMQTEISGMKQHIARLEDERDGVIQALTGSVEHLDGKHSALEQLIDQKVAEVEWRADQKIAAHINGANEQKQRELCMRVMHRLRMKWVFLTFNAWKGEWAEIQAEKNAVKTAAMKFFRTSMVYAFNTWRAHTVGEIKAKAEMSTKANYERIGKIEEAMGLEVEQRHHEIAQVNVVLKQLELLIDSRDQAEANRRHAEIDRKLRRTVRKLMMGALSECFEAWRGSWEEQKQKEQLLNKVRNMMMKKGVTLCFGAWKKWYELEVRDRAEASKNATAATNFEKISALEKVVEENKVSLETQIAAKAEDVQNFVTVKFEAQLRAFQEGMTLAEAKKKEDLMMKHQHNIIMRLLKKCMVQTFEVWKAQWMEKRDLERKLKKAVALFSKMPMVRCFRAWQIEWRSQNKHRAGASVQANYERLGELEAALQSETEQRHYEAEQVSKVLAHLENVFGTACDALHEKQEKHQMAIRQSGLRSIMFRMNNNRIGQAFQAFRLGIEGFRKEKMEKAREKNVMEKMFFLMNGNKKGSAFMTWKQAVERAKNAEARQTIYNLTELSTKVDKHDRMFITFAKTFRLIPENVSEMMQAQSPNSKGAGGAEEGVPPRGA